MKLISTVGKDGYFISAYAEGSNKIKEVDITYLSYKKYESLYKSRRGVVSKSSYEKIKFKLYGYTVLIYNYNDIKDSKVEILHPTKDCSNTEELKGVIQWG